MTAPDPAQLEAKLEAKLASVRRRILTDIAHAHHRALFARAR